MANISATLVKELRDITNIGMMECKKALVQAEGDKQKALTILKEKGLAVANKRADRETNEGNIFIKTSIKEGFMIQVECETDFVSNNDDFKNLVSSLGEKFVATPENFKENTEVVELVNDTSAKCGEKINIAEVITMKNDKGRITSYLHSNKKNGVLVSVNCNEKSLENEKFIEFCKDVSMQIAAMSPIALSMNKVSDEEKNSQKEVFLKQMEGDNKPPEIKEKIIQGKLNKYFGEKCLMQMEFVKEAKTSIQDLQNRTQKELGDNEIEIVDFKKFQIGN